MNCSPKYNLADTSWTELKPSTVLHGLMLTAPSQPLKQQHSSNFLLWLQQAEKHPQASPLHFPLSQKLLRLSTSKFRRFSLECCFLLPTWITDKTVKAQILIKNDYVLERHDLIVKIWSCWEGCGREPKESFEGKCLFHPVLKLLVFTLEGRCKCFSFTVWGTSPWRQKF